MAIDMLTRAEIETELVSGTENNPIFNLGGLQ